MVNVQVPRWMSAMLPTGKPSKSLVSQPESVVLLLPPGGMTTSTGVMSALTSPEPLNWNTVAGMSTLPAVMSVTRAPLTVKAEISNGSMRTV